MAWNKRTLLAAFATFLFAVAPSVPPALAHGPTPHKAEASVTVDVPIDRVWEAVSDFGGIARWHPLVQEAEGEDDGEARVLTLEGGQLRETLDVASKERGVVAWRLDELNPDALSASSYNDKILITSESAGRTTIRWTSRFYRADTSNYPKEGQTDEDAIADIQAYLDQGIEGLAAFFQQS